MLVSVQPNFQKLLETIEINKQKRHFLNFSNEKAYVYTHMYIYIHICIFFLIYIYTHMYFFFDIYIYTYVFFF